MLCNEILNGFVVPNPGPGVWAGFDHLATGGGEPRNLFGIDFMDDRFSWTEELCRKDSDGDERSNGEELEDLDCVWRIEGDGKLTPVVQASARLHSGIVNEPVVGQDVSGPCDTYAHRWIA